MRTLSRRTVLRGLGVSLSLPLLEAMTPARVLAATRPGQQHPGQQRPNRMAILYVPNGKNMAQWTPKQEGADYELPPTLQPLAAVKHKLMVLSGLTADKARPHGDGCGDHARALCAF